VTCVVSALAREMSQTRSPPLRSEVKTTFVPSGLKRGCPSTAIPWVSCVAVPPLAGIVYRSPSRSKTSVCPSGLMSTDIHEPSVVVNSTVRVGSRGRPSWKGFSSSWSAESGGSWAWTGAVAVVATVATARRAPVKRATSGWADLAKACGTVIDAPGSVRGDVHGREAGGRWPPRGGRELR